MAPQPAPPAVVTNKPKEGEVATTSTPEVKPTLSIKYTELKKIEIPTLEPPKPVVLDEDCINTLKSTLVYHFQILEQTAAGSRPAADTLRGQFYELFKSAVLKKYGKVDSEKLEDLYTVAEEFIKTGEREGEGKGAAIRLALKLDEWEEATLQAKTGIMFKNKKAIKEWQIDKIKRKRCKATKEGFAVEEYTPWYLSKFRKISRPITGYEYEFEGGRNLSNVLLTPEQTEFLIQAGLDVVNLTDKQKEQIEVRFSNIADLRINLYSQTGLEQKDIELNFIKKDPTNATGRNYRDNKTAHLIGEVSAGGPLTNVREIIEQEGTDIALDVKKKTEEELEKLKAKHEAGRLRERTHKQLVKRIAEIDTEAKEEMDEDEKVKKQTELQKEIDRLKEELALFGRKSALPNEIAEAEKARDKASDLVTDRQTKIKVPGEASVDLIKWAGDLSQTESWKYIEMQCKLLERQMQLLREQLTEARAGLKEHNTSRPQSDLRNIIQYDPKTGVKVADVKPDPVDVKEKEEFLRIQAELNKEIDDLKNKIYKDSWSGGTKPLAELIQELTDQYSRRKAAVEDPETKQLLDAYIACEKAVADKTKEQIEVEAKVTALAATADEKDELQIKAKKKKVQKEKEVVGAPSGKAKTEMQALTALEKIYTTQGETDLNNRIKEAEQDLLKFELSPNWEKFPPVIQRCIQLIYGDDVRETFLTDKDAYEQVMALMTSKKYLDIFIDAIESSGAVIAVLAPKASVNADGVYEHVDQVFHGATIVSNTFPLNIINEELIKKIVDGLRKKALNIP